MKVAVAVLLTLAVVVTANRAWYDGGLWWLAAAVALIVAALFKVTEPSRGGRR